MRFSNGHNSPLDRNMILEFIYSRGFMQVYSSETILQSSIYLHVLGSSISRSNLEGIIWIIIVIPLFFIIEGSVSDEYILLQSITARFCLHTALIFYKVFGKFLEQFHPIQYSYFHHIEESSIKELRFQNVHVIFKKKKLIWVAQKCIIQLSFIKRIEIISSILENQIVDCVEFLFTYINVENP